MFLTFISGAVQEITDDVIREAISLAPTYIEEDYVGDVCDRVKNMLQKEHDDSSCCAWCEITDLLVRHRYTLLRDEIVVLLKDEDEQKLRKWDEQTEKFYNSILKRREVANEDNGM